MPVPKQPRGALEGLLWITAANCLFALMTIAARLASRSAHWTMVGGSRALVGALVALGVGLYLKAPLKTKRRGLSWARSLLGTGSMLATFYAISSPAIDVGTAVTLFATSPIFIALLSPRVLGEHPSRGLWSILIVAFFGVALVAGPHLGLAALPALSALLAAVISACALMFLRIMRSTRDDANPESAEAIALHFGLVGFAAHAILGIFSFHLPEARDVFWLIVTGLSGGLAQLAMTRAFALTEAARLGAAGYLGTVMSFGSSVVFLGERPDASQIAGSVLVVTAGVALAISATRPLRSPAAAAEDVRVVTSG